VLSYGEKIVKIGPAHPEFSTKYAETRCERATQFQLECSPIRMFSAKTTGPIFTKILHDIVALGALFNHAYTRRYPISFLNARTISARAVGNFLHKIGCHGNVPWYIEKRGPDGSWAPKTLSFGEKIAKIGPADLEIICLREISKKVRKIKKERK